MTTPTNAPICSHGESENCIREAILAERLANSIGGRARGDVAATEDSRMDDLPSFGWLPDGGDRAIMLDVRRKDGNISAFNYNTLDQAEFDPSDGIALTFFSRKTVTIVGRNLNNTVCPNVRRIAGILQHRAAWIQEADRAAAIGAPQDATLVEEVKIK